VLGVGKDEDEVIEQTEQFGKLVRERCCPTVYKATENSRLG
jgi:hypothetical protein